MTNAIKNKIKRKNKKFKQWKDTGSLLMKTQYKQMQSDLKNLITEAKENYHKKLSNQLTKPENEHIFWSTIKRLTGNKKSC